MPKKHRPIPSIRKSEFAQMFVECLDALMQICVGKRLARRRRSSNSVFVRDTRKLIRICTKIHQLDTKADKISSLLAKLDLARSATEAGEDSLRANERLIQATLRLCDSIPKRKMSASRIETAQRYLELGRQYEQEHGESAKQLVLLLQLVNSQGEREKPYASRYHRTKDVEHLRGDIKSLMNTYKKHLERSDTGQPLPTT